MTSSSAQPGEPKRKQPESFRGRALSASLTVRDIGKTVAWYRDIVGFIVAQEYRSGESLVAVSLKAGKVEIVVTQDDGAKGLDRKKGDGFSLRITTAQNIDGLAGRIKERGGVLETEPADMWGSRTFRVVDPDGFKLVISSEG